MGRREQQESCEGEEEEVDLIRKNCLKTQNTCNKLKQQKPETAGRNRSFATTREKNHKSGVLEET